MSQSPFKTPEFQALFRKWNQILENDGHPEIEAFDLPDAPLKDWHSKWVLTGTHNRGGRRIEELRDYYDLASGLLNDFRFKSELHRLIWDLHCDGLSARQIVHELRFWLFDLEKTRVHEIIATIARDSGLKHE